MTREEIIAKYKDGHIVEDDAGFEDWNPDHYGKVEKAIIGAMCYDSLQDHGKTVKVNIWTKPLEWSSPMVEVTYSDGFVESYNIGIPSDEEVLYGYYRACGDYSKARAIKKAVEVKGEYYAPGFVEVTCEYHR